ncbi:MAG: hypothetical protein ACOYNB_11245 [Aquabacterium sp.]|uniref:hypothetical protein n=1 Tax=Aquabacterium sp. TaxID=1872578 RepID=UPI003BD28292
MSDKKIRRLPLAAAAMVACMSAHAGYTSPDGNFSLSGFGTLGASRTTTDEALFNYPGQGGGAGKTFSLDPDSKVAVQGTYKATPTVSATAQVMTKYDAEGSYVPNFEWAFVKWQPVSGLSVRAGRMGAPFFMVSDFRDVGYANVAVRPNLDVYGQVPVSYFDGGDVSYQTSLGPASVTGTLWAGSSSASFTSALNSPLGAVPPSDIDIKRALGFNLQAEFDGGYTLRLGHMQGRLTTKSATADYVVGAMAPVIAGLAGATAQAEALALSEQLHVSNERATFSGVGFTVDRNNVVVSGEYTKRKVGGVGYVPDTTGWYTLAGYRFGNWLPYVSFSKLKVTNPNAKMPTVTSAVLASAVVGTQTVLNTQKLSERTNSVGIRWDATSSLAVKAQFDRVVKPVDSNGLFLVENPSGALLSGGKFLGAKKNIDVLSLSVDFVF